MNHPSTSPPTDAAAAGHTGDKGAALSPSPSSAAPADHSARSARSWRQSPRDLVTIGVFGALYLVTVFVFVLVGFTHPVVMLASVPLGLIAGGVPFMLFLTRVEHGGMVFLFGLLLAGLHLATGHPLVGFPLTVGLALVAELILAAGRYRSAAASIGAYTVFAVWSVGPWLPLFMARDEFLGSSRMSRYGADAAAALQVLPAPALLVGMVVVAATCGALGALLGTRLTGRHFRAAGLA